MRKNILVTGANGQLGKELQFVAKENENFIFCSRQDLDITNTKDLERILIENDIKTIINCAAITDIQECELEKSNADRVNYLAVKSMGELCKKHSIGLVHLSTDYVFSGESFVPFLEKSVTEPKTRYGVSKLKGEKTILFSSIENCLVVRTSWLYSALGENFVTKILKNAKENKSIKAMYDQIGTPTNARDLAEFLVDIVTTNKLNNKKPLIYHYTNEGLTSCYDLAVEIVQMASLPCFVEAILSKDSTQKPKKPHFSVLATELIKNDFKITLPYWKKSLEKCIKELKG